MHLSISQIWKRFLVVYHWSVRVSFHRPYSTRLFTNSRLVPFNFVVSSSVATYLPNRIALKPINKSIIEEHSNKAEGSFISQLGTSVSLGGGVVTIINLEGVLVFIFIIGIFSFLSMPESNDR